LIGSDDPDMEYALAAHRVHVDGFRIDHTLGNKTS
jgi:hypothetical protein